MVISFEPDTADETFSTALSEVEMLDSKVSHARPHKKGSGWDNWSELGMAMGYQSMNFAPMFEARVVVLTILWFIRSDLIRRVSLKTRSSFVTRSLNIPQALSSTLHLLSAHLPVSQPICPFSATTPFSEFAIRSLPVATSPLRRLTGLARFNGRTLW